MTSPAPILAPVPIMAAAKSASPAPEQPKVEAKDAKEPPKASEKGDERFLGVNLL